MSTSHDSVQLGLILGSGTAVLMTLFSTPIMKRSGFEWIPLSAVSIVLGLILGGLLEAFADEDTLSSQEFDSGLFTFVLLPVIIFEAAYNASNYYCFLMLKPILMFAFWGTHLSFFILWPASTAFLSSSEAAMFAALISAVDPVATLSVLSDLKVNPRLEALIAGESILNDAMAIALYRAAKEFDGDVGKTIGEHIGMFILLVVVSVLIGLAFGVGSAYLFKIGGMRGVGTRRQNSRNHIVDVSVASVSSNVRNNTQRGSPFLTTEVIVFVILSYAPFLVAEICEQSGIVAAVVSGFCMKAFAQPNLTVQASNLVRDTFEVFAHAAETFVFVQVGISASLKLGDDFDFGFVCLTIVLCVLARAVSTFVLSALHNCSRTPESATYIPRNEQIVCWHAGLRGAIAFAVAFDFPGEKRDLIISTTCLVILFTVFAQGMSTTWVLGKAGVPMHVPLESAETLKRKESLQLAKSKFRQRVHAWADFVRSIVVVDIVGARPSDALSDLSDERLSNASSGAALSVAEIDVTDPTKSDAVEI